MSRVRKGTQADLPQLREVWSLCFPEDTEFNEYFFSKMYSNEAVRLIEDGGKVAAALYAFPYSVALPGGEQLEAWYIYGVGTRPSFRGHGLAGELIVHILGEARERGIDLCMLVPQDKDLFAFYEKFGFSSAFFFDEGLYAPGDSAVGSVRRAQLSDAADIDFIYEARLAEKVHIKRSEREWQLILEEYKMAGGGIYLLEKDGRICAYCTCAKECGELIVREIFAENTAAKNNVLSNICKEYGVKELKLFSSGKGEPYGSVYPISRAAEQIDFSSAYMNLMHS